MNADTASFESLDVVLRDYLDCRAQWTRPRLADLEPVTAAWVSAKSRIEAENTRLGTLFNPFVLASLRETLHSKILGELLDPNGSHGQGAMFLSCFLQRLNVPEPKAGNWRLKVEEDRVDIMITRDAPASVVLIENKANDAQDQPNQLFRYWYRRIHCRFPDLDYGDDAIRRSFRLIYLSSGGHKNPEPQSLECPADCKCEYRFVPLACERLGFDELMSLWCVAGRRVPETNARLRTFLEMYSEAWIS